MNILFLLTPKKDVVFAETDDTIRQAMEKMSFHRYTAIPILDQAGHYVGVVSDEDLLYTVKDNKLDWNLIMKIPLSALVSQRQVQAIGISKNVEELIPLIAKENFVPVIDDQRMFIGIVTRQAVIQYMADELFRKNNKDSPK
jgi:CBS-domain-containing membrane protein